MTATMHGPEQGQLTFTDPSPLRATDRRLTSPPSTPTRTADIARLTAIHEETP